MAEDPTIEVQVVTRHLPDHLPPDSVQFAFAYEITIINHSDVPVQLINRYWQITDSDGKSSEVQGSGVVGKQPTIAPGAQFSYTSGVILDTPVGNMQGYYEMQGPDGNLFRVPIDIFRLALPNVIN